MILPMDALIGCISADENSLNDEKYICTGRNRYA